MIEDRWIVSSESTPNKTYEVVRVGDRFACSCPNHIYRGRQCKHIRKIKMRLAGEAQKNKLPQTEDEMEEKFFSRGEVKEHLKRIKEKEKFIPLEEIKDEEKNYFI